jgi:triosephosphate isomerase
MDNRTPLIAGNWKMHKTSEKEGDQKLLKQQKALVKLVADTTDVDIMIAPVFTALDPVSTVVKNSRVGLGGQNLHWAKEGAYHRGNICSNAGICRMSICHHRPFGTTSVFW